MNNDATVERMANAMLGEPVTPKGDTLTATDIRYSMSPTYRIKPLAWENNTASFLGLSVHVVGKDGLWRWEIVNDDSWASHAKGYESTLDAAKSAAESAYRALVAEHLEVVA